MKRYSDTVLQRATGLALQGASVTVYIAGTDQIEKAILYGENDADTDAIANPVLTDQFGRFEFYTADGTYDLRIDFGSQPSRFFFDVEIYDLDELKALIGGAAVSNPNLQAFALLQGGADRLPYFAAANDLELTDFTPFARLLLAEADAAGVRELISAATATTENAVLAAIGGLQPVADRLPYFTGQQTAALTTLTAIGRALLAVPDLAALRDALDLTVGQDVQAYSTALATYATVQPSALGLLVLASEDQTMARQLLGVTESYRYGGFAVSGITANEILLDHDVSTAHALGANFVNSLFVSVGTPPAAAFVLDIRRNGVSIGTATIATNGTVTLATVGGTGVAVAARNIISVHAPAAVDASIARLRFTFRGNI